MDTIFFIAAKLFGFFLKVETWLLLLSIVTYWAALGQRSRLAKGTSAVLVIGILTIGLLPVGDLALGPIEYEVSDFQEPDHVDGIVVLGGGEDVDASIAARQPQTTEGGDRYLAAIALARRFPEARILFAGGSGRLRDAAGASVSEARIAAQIFADVGIDPKRILLEHQSRNTAENARLSLEMADPKPEETWLLVTSAFHMPRALRSFAEAGWEGVRPYPVDYRTRSVTGGLEWNFARNLSLLNTAIKEWVGQAVYAATGR